MRSFDRRSEAQRRNTDPVARYLGSLQAEVMAIFWARESATVREVVAALGRRRKPAYTTILTLVSRLYARGLLEREPHGRGYRYRAAKSRDEFLAELSDELIDRLLNDFGEIAVVRFDERLSALDRKQRERLQRLRRKRR